jgi:predicted nucleotidyltransferase
MSQQELEALLSELKQGLSLLYGIRLKGVFLFGSYARKTQDLGSDLDVLIILDDLSLYSTEINRTGELASNLSLQYGTSISRTFIRENDWRTYDTPLLRNVRAEAIPL